LVSVLGQRERNYCEAICKQWKVIFSGQALRSLRCGASRIFLAVKLILLFYKQIGL
jgi:hypothetical protein